MSAILSSQARTDAAALTLRVALGAMYLSHGLLKTFDVSGTVGFFGSLGLPPVLAHATIAFEVVGGLALLAGYGSRVVSLLGVPVLLGALFMVHLTPGFLFSAPGGGWEYPAFLALSSLAVFALGDGRWSLAAVLKTTPVPALVRANA